jgi:hypothetical protein
MPVFNYIITNNLALICYVFSKNNTSVSNVGSVKYIPIVVLSLIYNFADLIIMWLKGLNCMQK